MDPVSHAAFGRTLIALDGRRRLGPGAAAACVIGSLAPDMDIAQALRGWDVYLLHHQSGTHSLAGAVLCGALTATIVRVFCPSSRWPALALAGSTGAIGHMLLDLVSGADIRALWPLRTADITLPLFAMADPWLLGMLVSAVATLWWRPRPKVAVVALAMLAAMLGIKVLLYARACAIDRRSTATTAVHTEAVFGSWRRWRVLHADEQAVERWDVDVWDGTSSRTARVARGFTDPLVAASRTLSTVANLSAAHDATFARVRPLIAGGHEVLWTDLRYCGAAPDGSDPACVLWFGGEYDTWDRPIATVVYVGDFVQRRAPAAARPDEQ